MSQSKNRNAKLQNSSESQEICFQAGLPSNLLTIICVLLIGHYTFERLRLSTELAFEATALNNTGRGEKEVLFFNRVPKVGSQTIMDLLKHLQV
jgi:hypothetical protein